jgi:hypothetical protein
MLHFVQARVTVPHLQEDLENKDRLYQQPHFLSDLNSQLRLIRREAASHPPSTQLGSTTYNVE